MRSFSGRVLEWFAVHGRKDLPWQKADACANAYGVWVSEIMLQQTQVQTVIPYYDAFMQSFPDLVALADAEIDDVLKHWSGLGYYARARNLHKAARTVRDDHDGVFPNSFDAAVALPGIGRSTAGAILSLAFGARQPILDGNVKRVLARHEAIDGWPGRTAVANQLWEVADRNTPHSDVARYTQAIMDLGATICTRSKPQCDACPVAADCKALAAGTIDIYPGRKTRQAKPLKQTTMVLALNADAVYLERRPPAGIWGGLWSLPEIESSDIADWCWQTFGSRDDSVECWETLRHSFSHYDLDIQPVVVRVAASAARVADGAASAWYRLGDSPPGGIAAPVQKLIDTLKTGDHVQND